MQDFEFELKVWFCAHDMHSKPLSLFVHICIFPEHGSSSTLHSSVSESKMSKYEVYYIVILVNNRNIETISYRYISIYLKFMNVLLRFIETNIL